MDTNSLLKLTNSAGYAFQLAIEQEIHSGCREAEWVVEAREHPWQNRYGARGYVDLVLAAGDHRVVMEIKRPRNAQWVFLVPSTDEDEKKRCRYLWSNHHPEHSPISGWADAPVTPESYEAMFCVIRGSSEDRSPYLENVASTLVAATEAIAEQILKTLEKSSHMVSHSYYPVIVTTAALSACKLDPTSVPIETGTLDNAEFEAVPYIRLRKALSSLISEWPKEQWGDGLGRVNVEAQRTVFVVNAEHVVRFMNAFERGRTPFEIQTLVFPPNDALLV